jgi:ATP-binding cassette subfamily F protein 3
MNTMSAGLTLRYNPLLGSMSLITGNDLAKSFGALDVFSNVTFAIPHEARIALVGPNGVGKTTLLRIITGLDVPDEGQLNQARKLHIGYLPQEATYSRSKREELKLTLWELCLSAFKDLRRMEEKVRHLENLMADPQHVEDAMSRYGPLQEAFELAGGYTYPARIRQVLNGLGFSQKSHSQSLAELSGGERTRALLACLLLEDPQLLVLDEPTNHLDVQAVEWLESWLEEWSGAAVIVSHDRYFLDRTVDTIWELFSKGLETYRGNYSAYLRHREERRSHQLTEYQAQQDLIHKEEDYIRRNIAGQNTRQAQGRRKRLKRLKRDHLIERPTVDQQVRINFRKTSRSGDRVIETQNLEIGFVGDPAPLFRVPDLLLLRGECVGIMGPNGAGKTTFLRTLVGEIPPFAGDVNLGASLEVAYFAQAHEGLRPDYTALEEIKSIDPDLRDGDARNILALFLFRGDEVFKLIDTLSGGERGRVALAKLMLEGANLLLLDEPTNHLDIPSQEALQSALAQYPGTILLISHDRYLVNALASQVWVISADTQEMEIFTGGYQEYLEIRKQRSLEKRTVRKQTSARPVPKKKRAKVNLEDIESRISSLEQQLAILSDELVKAGDDIERVRELGKQYATVEDALREYLAIWERLANHQEHA